jgi:hypothetical protein
MILGLTKILISSTEAKKGLRESGGSFLQTQTSQIKKRTKPKQIRTLPNPFSRFAQKKLSPVCVPLALFLATSAATLAVSLA